MRIAIKMMPGSNARREMTSRLDSSVHDYGDVEWSIYSILNAIFGRASAELGDRVA